MDGARRESSGYYVEELGIGLVRLAGGVTLDIVEAWALHLGSFEGSSILGSAGGIRLEPFSYHATLSDLEMNASFELDRADWRRHQIRKNEDAYDSPPRHWIAALRGRVPLLPTAETALKTMLISEGIYLSDSLGRELTAAEVEDLSESTALRV